MIRLSKTAFVIGTLMAPVALSPVALFAADRVYHDTARNDDHHWNADEDRAYRQWVRENHRHYTSFNKLKEGDQRAYWAWRHDHLDHH
jgi:hypothetical protein